MRRARLPLAGVILAIAAVAVIIAVTSGGSARANRSAAANSAISLRQTQLGGTLADAQGRTLYLFEGDKPNRSTLSSAGQAVWPPFTSATRPQALNGVMAGSVGAIKDPDGAFQITYNGHPLYYYVGDRGAGQTHGQGLNQFGALWYVLNTNGRAVMSAAQTTTPATPSSTGAASYGY
jgi:predicted lipoprotein with Yx(FWY)xxD motif